MARRMISLKLEERLLARLKRHAKLRLKAGGKYQTMIHTILSEYMALADSSDEKDQFAVLQTLIFRAKESIDTINRKRAYKKIKKQTKDRQQQKNLQQQQRAPPSPAHK